MPEEIEREYATAAFGEPAREGVLHAARKQQPGEEDDDPRSGAVLAEGEALPLFATSA